MSASFYVYWNLHKKCWSVKHRGKVEEHVGAGRVLALYDCTFSVSEKGRQRVLANRRKNVHAYIRCESYITSDQVPEISPQARRLTYNPYEGPGFVFADDRKPCYKHYPILLLLEDKQVWTKK